MKHILLIYNTLQLNKVSFRKMILLTPHFFIFPVTLPVNTTNKRKKEIKKYA